MASTLGYTKLACTSTQLNTTFHKGVSESLRTGDIFKQMGYDSEEKFQDMWFNTFREHSLSFSHWYKMYQHERANQIELAKMIHTYQIEQNDDNDN
jgi:hypothetical protein